MHSGPGRVCEHAPTPITNREMMAAYRTALGRRIGLPAPAWAVKIGAPLLGLSASLALTSRRAVPKRLADDGFTFEHQAFLDAVRDGLTRSETGA